MEYAPIGKPKRSTGVAVTLTFALLLGLLACNGPHFYGVNLVGIDTEGHLIAKGEWGAEGDFDVHRSEDGGHTWEFIDPVDRDIEYSWVSYPETDDPEVAFTPRGYYHIQTYALDGNGDSVRGPHIVRTSNDAKEEKTVFSMGLLLDRANIALQRRTRWGEETKLLGLHYDAASGNVIAAMGTQGALVVMPDGSWTRVGVGRFVPTDFSAVSRTRLLTTTPLYWLSTLALSVLATATACLLAVVRSRVIGGAFILAGAGLAAVYLFGPIEWLLYILLVLNPVSVIVAIILLLNWGRETRKRKSLALTVVGLALTIAMMVFPGFPEIPGLSDIGYLLKLPIILIVGLPILLLVTVAIVPYHPEGREWLDVGIAVSSMIIVSVVPVALWMQYTISYETAKWASIGLVAVIAIGLFIRLKYLQRMG